MLYFQIPGKSPIKGSVLLTVAIALGFATVVVSSRSGDRQAAIQQRLRY